MAIAATSVLATAPAAADPVISTWCTPDPASWPSELGELSGIAQFGESVWGMGDSGSDTTVYEISPGADNVCVVGRTVPNPFPPNDVEDLVAAGEWLWLADIGDNGASRDSIALGGLNPDTGAVGPQLRFEYGADPVTGRAGGRDAEALLVAPDGTPIIVSKSYFGRASIWGPATPISLTDPTLADPANTNQDNVIGPIILEKWGDVPAPSSMVTSAAVGPDGTIALRDYSTVQWWTPAPSVDARGWAQTLVTGQRGSVAIDQPQGEAIGYLADGTLLVASEQASAAVPPPILAVRLDGDGGAAASSAAPRTEIVPGMPPEPSDPGTQPAAAIGSGHDDGWLGGTRLVVGGAVIVALLAAIGLARSRRR